MLVKILVHSTICHTYSSLYSLLCHFVLLYVVHTPVMVQASIAFFLLLSSPLDLLVPPPSIFSLASTSFGYSAHLWVTFRMLVAIFCHILFMSSSSFQEPYLITLSLNTSDVSSFSFHHFVLSILTCLSLRACIGKRKSATKSLCWETTHSPRITLQPKHARLSFLLARTKSIWLECCPLLKVTRCCQQPKIKPEKQL